MLRSNWSKATQSINSLMRQFIDLLNEAPVANMQVLNDATDLVLSILPRSVQKGEVTNRSVSWAAASKLAEKYANTPFEEALKGLAGIPIVINNQHKTSSVGAYMDKPHRALFIYVKSLIGDEADFDLPQAQGVRLDNKAIQSLRGIILHELRHHFQTYLYPGYFALTRDTHDGKYRTDPIEIDAAWHHHLSEIEASQFETATAYADAVMASFGAYKDLTPQRHQHYRRKTIQYWTSLNDPSTVRDETLLQRHERIQAEFRQSLADMLTLEENDLRILVPGYDQGAPNFWIKEHIRPAIRAMVLKPFLTAGNAPWAYLCFAMGNMEDPAPVRKFLEKLSGVKAKDAIEDLDRVLDRYDSRAIISWVKDRFDIER